MHADNTSQHSFHCCRPAFDAFINLGAFGIWIEDATIRRKKAALSAQLPLEFLERRVRSSFLW